MWRMLEKNRIVFGIIPKYLSGGGTLKRFLYILKVTIGMLAWLTRSSLTLPLKK